MLQNGGKKRGPFRQTKTRYFVTNRRHCLQVGNGSSAGAAWEKGDQNGDRTLAALRGSVKTKQNHAPTAQRTWDEAKAAEASETLTSAGRSTAR